MQKRSCPSCVKHSFWRRCYCLLFRWPWNPRGFSSLSAGSFTVFLIACHASKPAIKLPSPTQTSANRTVPAKGTPFEEGIKTKAEETPLVGQISSHVNASANQIASQPPSIPVLKGFCNLPLTRQDLALRQTKAIKS